MPSLLFPRLLCLASCLLLAGCASQPLPPLGKNYLFETMASARKVRLQYSGTAEVHKNLGPAFVVSASQVRTGTLTLDVRLAARPPLGDQRGFTTLENQYRLNGHALENNNLSGGTSPMIDSCFNYITSYDSIASLDTMSFDGMIEKWPADAPLSTKKDYDDFYVKLTVKPNAATLSYNGRAVSTTLIEERYMHGMTMTRHMSVYISDEVPGRIVQLIDRGFDNDGGKLGTTRLALTTAVLE